MSHRHPTMAYFAFLTHAAFIKGVSVQRPWALVRDRRIVTMAVYA